MVGGSLREQTRRMTIPTVVETTPQPAAVTPDTFIDGLTAPQVPAAGLGIRVKLGEPRASARWSPARFIVA